MVYILLAVGFLCSALVTAAAVPLVRAISHRSGWVDKPDGKRKLHSKPVATAGGVAIAAGFVAGLAYMFAIREFLPFSLSVPSAAIWFAGAVMLATGFYDDVRGLGFKHKFLIQVTVALILIQSGLRIDTSAITFIDLDPYNQTLYSITLTALWIVGVMNAVNLIDGLDGLAGGVSLIAFASLGIAFGIQGGAAVAILAVLIAGALAAFLIYNFNPASIFMGDSGSLFLGFLLAAYSLQGQAYADPILALLVPVVILGFPVADTTLSIIRRLGKRQAVCSPDQDHIHHRLLRRFNTPRAVLILYGVTVGLGAIAIMMIQSPPEMALGLFAAAFVFGAAGIHLLGYEPVQDLRQLYARPSVVEIDSETAADLARTRAVVQAAEEQAVYDRAVEEHAFEENELHVPTATEQEQAGDGMHGRYLPLLSFSSMFKPPKIMISKDSVVKLENDVTAAHLDGESVLLNLKTGNYFSVNEVGSSILNLIQEPKPVRQVIDTLLEEYAVAPDQLENDVIGFLKKMEEQRLLDLAVDHAEH